MSKAKKKEGAESAPDEPARDSAGESGDAGTPIDIETGSGVSQSDLLSGVEDKGLHADGSDTDGDSESLVAQVADLEDKLLRKQADFENFRKRMIRDREDGIRHANANLLLDLVDVIDNFERAIKSSEESKDFASLHEGIEMIEKQFTGMLENKWGLKRFESIGEEFDPERHEAITTEERDTDGTQKVLEDYQKGYLLHDRVLRHSKVKVSVPVSSAGKEESAADENGSDENVEQSN